MRCESTGTGRSGFDSESSGRLAPKRANSPATATVMLRGRTALALKPPTRRKRPELSEEQKAEIKEAFDLFDHEKTGAQIWRLCLNLPTFENGEISAIKY